MEKNPREIALDILLDIEKNKIFSNIALNTGLRSNQFMSKQERAFITRLVEGVVETRIRLDYIINSFSNTKVNKCKPLIRCILRMGTYQIFYMEKVPDEAACNECVKLAEKRGFRNLKGFVNGVLRNISRNKDNIKYPDKANEHRKYISVMYSVPEEVIDILEEDYSPEDVESIVGAAFADRSTAIRVNRDRISVDEFKKELESNGISVRRGNYTDNTLLIDDYDYIRKIPGFHQGYFNVTDESSVMAVDCAGINKGDLVLDMCAAPGGKTMYAAELTGPTGTVISRDVSDKKVELIEENIERLGYENVKPQVFDACVYDETMEGKADVVLCDVPCSGLGIMGRKNDIKYNIDKAGVISLSELSKQILSNACRYVKPGGTLLFSTCTITGLENEDTVKWIRENTDLVPETLADHLPENLKDRGNRGYMTLLQGKDSCDGFFMARFVRKR